MNLIPDLWMLYIEQMIPVGVSGDQKSFEVTRGQTLKTLKTQYLKKENVDDLILEEKITHIEKMISIVFGEVQKSVEVT